MILEEIVAARIRGFRRLAAKAQIGYTSTVRRLQRKFLVGSRWTTVSAFEASRGERHFEVQEIVGGDVVMFAPLTRCTYRIAIAALEDPAAWQPGWQQLSRAP